MMAEYPEVEYLSATLELFESGQGEVAKFVVTPLFDQPQVELHVIEGHDAEEDGMWLMLNRRQIECLSDFLVCWLARLPAPKGTT